MGGSRIRIGCLLGGYTQGGTEKMSLLTYPRLDRSRFRVVCIFLSPAHGLTREFQGSGLEVVNLDIPEERRYLNAPRLIFILRRLAREKKLDILHGFGAFCDLCARLARGNGLAPILVTGRRSVSHRSGREGRSLFHALAERWTRNRVDLYISNTRAGQEVMIREEGISPRKTRVIHNGLLILPDPPKAAPEKESGQPIVISVALLENRKDPACLLRAAALVRDQNLNFRLLMVGDGPLKNEAERLCAELSLEDRVEFLGCRQDVENLLSQAQVFALASCYEGMPVAVMEAMAAGLPVAVTDVGGNAELVQEGVTGFLTPRGDPEALARSMDKLLRGPGAEVASGPGRSNAHTGVVQPGGQGGPIGKGLPGSGGISLIFYPTPLPVPTDSLFKSLFRLDSGTEAQGFLSQGAVRGPVFLTQFQVLVPAENGP